MIGAERRERARARGKGEKTNREKRRKNKENEIIRLREYCMPLHENGCFNAK